jgi:hypothetical protein
MVTAFHPLAPVCTRPIADIRQTPHKLILILAEEHIADLGKLFLQVIQQLHKPVPPPLPLSHMKSNHECLSRGKLCLRSAHEGIEEPEFLNLDNAVVAPRAGPPFPRPNTIFRSPGPNNPPLNLLDRF